VIFATGRWPEVTGVERSNKIDKVTGCDFIQFERYTPSSTTGFYRKILTGSHPMATSPLKSLFWQHPAWALLESILHFGGSNDYQQNAYHTAPDPTPTTGITTQLIPIRTRGPKIMMPRRPRRVDPNVLSDHTHWSQQTILASYENHLGIII
jgi:hypothetical protein